jgi:hypothetical protein
MTALLTSNEFVTGLLCELKLRGVTQLRLAGSTTDTQFAKAYDDLISRSKELDIVVDFSLATDPYHGDSETLRETLYAARQKGIVAINNPSFKTVEIRLDKDEASEFLTRVPLPREYWSQMVDKYFPPQELERSDRVPDAAEFFAD